MAKLFQTVFACEEKVINGFAEGHHAAESWPNDHLYRKQSAWMETTMTYNDIWFKVTGSAR